MACKRKKTCHQYPLLFIGLKRASVPQRLHNAVKVLEADQLTWQTGYLKSAPG